MLYKVVLAFESGDKILKSLTIRMKATEQYFPVVLFIAVQGGSSFWVCWWNPQVWPFKWKLLSSTFLLLIMLYKMALTLILDESQSVPIK